MNDNCLATVTRGERSESRHTGRVAIVDGAGGLIWACGDVTTPIFPRSTVKPLLALTLVASGAADRMGLQASHLALACASHGGEAEHTKVASQMLEKTGKSVNCLACGAHWPTYEPAARDLAAAGAMPSPLHNNCSGKHAGLICLCVDQGIDPLGYVLPEHPIQKQVTAVLAEVTASPHQAENRGIDGCSMPTYAIPLRDLARGMARFGSGETLSADMAAGAARLRQAIAQHPLMVAGHERFDTRLMTHFKERIFCKMGAEGVMVAALPELGLGIAIKVDDGANRAAEVALAGLLLKLGAHLWSSEDLDVLHHLSRVAVHNWNGTCVGHIQSAVQYP